MRHRHQISKLGRTGTHRRALLSNMATSLFREERITTTHAKAMALRPYAERLITLGKRGDVNARRLAARQVHDKPVLAKLFDELAERYKEREGGYTRVLKMGHRTGDKAKMALIELVDAKIDSEVESTDEE